MSITAERKAELIKEHARATTTAPALRSSACCGPTPRQATIFCSAQARSASALAAAACLRTRSRVRSVLALQT